MSLSLFLCFSVSLSLSVSLHIHTNTYTCTHRHMHNKNIHHVQNTHASHTTNIHARTHAHILNTNVQNAPTETESRIRVPLKTYLISLFKCPSPASLLPPPDSPSFHVADDLRWDHVRRPSTHPVQQATTVITEEANSRRSPKRLLHQLRKTPTRASKIQQERKETEQRISEVPPSGVSQASLCLQACACAAVNKTDHQCWTATHVDTVNTTRPHQSTPTLVRRPKWRKSSKTDSCWYRRVNEQFLQKWLRKSKRNLVAKKARTYEWVIVTYGRFLVDRRAPRVTKATCTFWSQPKARENL